MLLYRVFFTLIAALLWTVLDSFAEGDGGG
jgi:hypothetical protein